MTIALATSQPPKVIDDALAEFRRQAFLAALTGIMASRGWNMDGKDCTQIDQKVELAWRTADHALGKSGLI